MHEAFVVCSPLLTLRSSLQCLLYKSVEGFATTHSATNRCELILQESGLECLNLRQMTLQPFSASQGLNTSEYYVSRMPNSLGDASFDELYGG